MMDEAGRALRGKSIVVTGGTTGIGRATTKLLAEQGADVLICGRHQPELDGALQAAAGRQGQVRGIVADIAIPEGAAELFAEVDRTLGRLDILVTCAALGAQPLHEMDEQEWRYVVETNLVGTLVCARAAIQRFAPAKGGHLLFVSSISPDIKAPGESVYAATKGGINAFAMTLRKELADRNIRVSVIAPGSVGTDMQECSVEEQRKAIARHEMLYAEDIAEAILFALTRPQRCDVTELRVEPRLQKVA
jgi:NAD(P)-dependent dehydrogenase (short-subunit alcohol dehydrogenase family)